MKSEKENGNGSKENGKRIKKFENYVTLGEVSKKLEITRWVLNSWFDELWEKGTKEENEKLIIDVLVDRFREARKGDIPGSAYKIDEKTKYKLIHEEFLLFLEGMKEEGKLPNGRSAGRKKKEKYVRISTSLKDLAYEVFYNCLEDFQEKYMSYTVDEDEEVGGGEDGYSIVKAIIDTCSDLKGKEARELRGQLIKEKILPLLEFVIELGEGSKDKEIEIKKIPEALYPVVKGHKFPKEDNSVSGYKFVIYAYEKWFIRTYDYLDEGDNDEIGCVSPHIRFWDMHRVLMLVNSVSPAKLDKDYYKVGVKTADAIIKSINGRGDGVENVPYTSIEDCPAVNYVNKNITSPLKNIAYESGLDEYRENPRYKELSKSLKNGEKPAKSQKKTGGRKK